MLIKFGAFLRHHWLSAASWTLALAAWIAAFTASTEVWLTWTLRTVAAGFTLAGGVRLVKAWRKRPNNFPGVVEWGYAPPYDTWSELKGDAPETAVFSSDLNLRLTSGDPVYCTVRTEVWRPSAKSSAYLEYWKERGRLGKKKNGTKLRLCTSLLADTTQIVLQLTDYASFGATNRLAYRDYGEGGLAFQDVEPTLRGPRPLLPRFEQSQSSNHIGGDILLVGSDYTILQLQNARNAMFPDHWVAYASGSFDAADAVNRTNLQDVVKAGLLREASEECRIKGIQTPSFEDTKVIGFSRATYLGGKPQFYGVARTDGQAPGHSSEIQGDRYGRSFQILYFERGDASSLVDVLQAHCRRHYRFIAPPLAMLLKTLEDWLASDRSAEQWLFRGCDASP